MSFSFSQIISKSGAYISRFVARVFSPLLVCAGRSALILLAMGQVSACSGGTGTGAGQQPNQTVAITTQPASQTIPIGQPATFSVVASGTPPFTYQWSENGSVVSGAVGASFVTSGVTVGDSGATFTVSVSNGISSVTSNGAILTVGPRSPKAGDLRFQQVGASTEAEQGVASSAGGITFQEAAFRAQAMWHNNAVGSPMTVGSQGGCYLDPAPFASCYWRFMTTPLPTGQSGLNAYFQGGLYANFDSDLTSSVISGQAPPDSHSNVITSLDFVPAYNAYGIAWAESTLGGGFDLKREKVLPGAVQTAVAKDAAQSRVVTAISFDADGLANLLSYGWQGDTTTTYDTSVTSAAAPDVASAAQVLAADGYILTAFGGDGTNGFLLVGTKVQGDTLARPLMIPAKMSPPPGPGWGVDYAPVVWLDYLAPDETSGISYVIYEK